MVGYPRSVSVTVLVFSVCIQIQHTEAVIQTTVNSRGDLSDPTLQTIPPSRVTDLTIVNFDCKSGTLRVTLKWTAPGADGTTGTAGRYDIRVAQGIDVIKRNFNAAPKIEPGLLINGSFQPHVAGSKEELTAWIPGKAVWDTYVFALKTFDTDDNASPISNNASFDRPSDCQKSSTTTNPSGTAPGFTVLQNKPTTDSQTSNHSKSSTNTQTLNQSDSDSSSSNTGAIVGGIVGVLASLVLTGIIITVVKKSLYAKVKLHPDPLNANMTEPSIPYQTFALKV